MPSPMMTVLVLVVLWLIVVVPMVLRRSDERRRERSVEGFGRSMRALGRRPASSTSASSGAAEVFVPIQNRARLAAPQRRPVPAAQEALMYPPDRTDMSEARTQMLARRRRSLGILAGGSVLFGLLALMMGGALWLLAAPFLIGLVGYVWFLRNQALRDRSRRENRQLRAATRRDAGWDATDDDVVTFERRTDDVVRIDDDDIELMSMDTMDLTGVFEAESAPAATQRRAS